VCFVGYIIIARRSKNKMVIPLVIAVVGIVVIPVFTIAMYRTG